jgi:hypothetical protein
MSEAPSYCFKGIIDGVEKTWTYPTVEAVMKVWDVVAARRTTHDTREPVTDLRLFLSGERATVTLGPPYGGLAVP